METPIGVDRCGVRLSDPRSIKRFLEFVGGDSGSLMDLSLMENDNLLRKWRSKGMGQRYRIIIEKPKPRGFFDRILNFF